MIGTSLGDISVTEVRMTIVHRVADRQKVQDAIENWNVHAGVAAIYETPEFVERKIASREEWEKVLNWPKGSTSQ